MNARQRQYLFGILFIGFGIYQLVKNDGLEAVLYMTAGAAFIFNTVATEPSLLRFKKPLVVVTWMLIIATGLLFLWLLQFKYL